ncbi:MULTISPECIES: META domain-containing protein [unclassified Methanoculleus]|uniref:META domain-containing protein n=1 Tax=unclassified Methanoculleus TaxID=2619537 RepID=UPI0025F55FCE|nr:MULTISPECIES: META domain-containing protein [unclassified Methanoculleus]MCK9317794.1 META domain-containing protein [Methanoculleus sp.]MDD2254946.1 META domain-containing protein [Methanoculleus sp.]MDD2787860.1 META domain-containing protein [Methanoculleus sp.]MDD3216671.1 META domain-containing protein [Methanoculleus sp.]MDD4315011.1 META domain-containing protein [Methanoculleus sp.]
MALNRRNRSHILATASLLVITAACIIAAGCTAGTSAPGAVSGLNGVTWSLDSYLDENDTLIPVLSGTEVSARFDDDGKVGGSAGCNYYGGNYSLDGTDLSVSSLVQTLKLCTEPEGIMDQEARFMELLGSAAGCRIEDERLILTDADGTDVLVFTKEEPAELAGTSWELATLSDENGAMIPVLAGTNVTLVFGADGGLGGSAGCNSYGADCTVDGANLTIEPPIRTEMYCSEPPGLMDQEDRYLAHLTNTSSYRTEGGRLIFTDHEGADLLVFEPVAPTPDLPFTGTDWVLEAYSTGGDAVSSVLAGTTITANFADGNVTGNAGCNHYGGQYSLDGATLSVSSVYSTLMYCETPGVMEQEGRFMGLLANVSSYRVEGDRLILTDTEGTDVLFFVQAPEVPPAPLTGTGWTLESYSLNGEAISSVIAGTTITAEFSPDGNVTGNAGCNSYGAGYVLDGANLTIEPPISTKMYCNEPEGVMEQENTYLNLLSSVSSYRVEGNRLSLANEAGTDLLTFVQAPSSEGRWMSPPDGGDYDLLDEDGNVVASY